MASTSPKAEPAGGSGLRGKRIAVSRSTAETAPLADLTLLARYELRGETRTRRLEARLFVP